jgi:hypothetical protein
VKLLLLILVLLIAWAAEAAPADREVLVYVNTGATVTTGSEVQRYHTLLFLHEPCPLPLAHASEMRRAWMAYGAYQLGCWYPTIDGDYVFVGQLPGQTHASGFPLAAMPRALLHAEGTATITEPGYDSRTFLTTVTQRQWRAVQGHMRELP